jgi:hypothetical protein
MIDIPPDLTTTSYRKIGFCIYCGSTTPPLTREHVVPRGLGGKIAPVGAHTAAVLGKASCERCRKVTHKFETICQQQMFGHLRIRSGMKQSEAPDTVSGLLRFADGSTKEVHGHPADFPALLFMPLLRKSPGLWLPNDSEEPPLRRFVGKLIFKPRQPSAFEAPEVGTEIAIDVPAYQRMIAKIALGAAILKHGPDHFQPLVDKFIRGDEPNAVGRYLFGYDLQEEKPSAGGKRGHHLVMTREHTHRDGINYVIGFVRLFANYGTPTHGVVVGVVK